MKEIWKDIKGYEGLYQISNTGKVMSLNYNHTHKPALLSIKINGWGYAFVTLCSNKVYTHKRIHVLVADAFIDNPFDLPVINHIDGNKLNNCVDNLERVTYSENTRHAIRTGLRKDTNMRGVKGADNKNSRPVLQYSKDGSFIKKWDSISDAARFYGCNPCTIVNASKGRLKTCKGFIWKRVEASVETV